MTSWSFHSYVHCTNIRGVQQKMCGPHISSWNWLVFWFSRVYLDSNHNEALYHSPGVHVHLYFSPFPLPFQLSPVNILGPKDEGVFFFKWKVISQKQAWCCFWFLGICTVLDRVSTSLLSITNSFSIIGFIQSNILNEHRTPYFVA